MESRIDKLCFKILCFRSESREGICKVGVELTKQIIRLVKGLQTDVSLVAKDLLNISKIIQ